MPLHHCPLLPPSKLQSSRCARRRALLAASALTIIGCSSAWAADGDANGALMKKLEKMEQRIQTLEAELKAKQISPSEKQTSSSDQNKKPTTASASPKNANAAVPADQPQDSPAKAASKT